MKHSASGLKPNLGPSAISKPLLPFTQAMHRPVERLCLHNPRSATLVEDAIEFQLLRGPHKVVPGTIPSGMSLALMAWGIIRAFEVCDDLDDYDYDSESEYYDEEMNDEWMEESYYVSYDDYQSDSTSTPDSSGPSTPCDQDASTYEAVVVHLNSPQLALADHEWPVVFGKRDEPPVRSRWLVPFEDTAKMLQHKAFMVANYLSL